MITGGDLRQSRLDVGYKTFTISPWWEPPFVKKGGFICTENNKGTPDRHPLFSHKDVIFPAALEIN